MRNNECIYMKQVKAFYPFCFTGYTHIVNSVVWAMHYYPLDFVLCLLFDKAETNYANVFQIMMLLSNMIKVVIFQFQISNTSLFQFHLTTVIIS
jgi:hypothetical protein